MFASVFAALTALGGPWVTVTPGTVTLRHAATVTVGGIAGPTMQVRLSGASVAFGHRTPWTALHKSGATWTGTLPVPELRGIYPVEVRTRPGATVVRSDHWFLRVFARGTGSRPSFATPEEVARWWVRTKPPRATLSAVRRWPRPAFDLRDPRLHQRMVIAYDVPVAWPPIVPTAGRSGLFIVAVRDGYRGRWRFLEATTSP